MNSREAMRYLRKRGATFTPAKGGHMRVILAGRFAILPMHGHGKELGKGLWHKILKDLGLKA